MIGIPETTEEVIRLLDSQGEEENALFRQAAEIRDCTIGNQVYLRGLIELSNVCGKDCLYCGIRRSNTHVERYRLTEKEVVEAAVSAYEQRLGSVVLQAGEIRNREQIVFVERVLKEIKRNTDDKLGITLSLGEQDEDTYKRWFQNGAHRYLLRIETSDEQLYQKIHPRDTLHSFKERLDCIGLLQKTGYQTGSGIMIGLPFQTTTHLAKDLLFLKSIDIDMVGMGPYLEHADTPLFAYRESLLPISERLRLALHMIAVLRLLLPDINIASTTALQTIDPEGREKGLMAGANVIMPNITPHKDRKKYNLYQNKPYSEESTQKALSKLSAGIERCGCSVALGEWGDPKHYFTKKRIG